MIDAGEELLATYRRDGVATIRGLFSAELVAQIRVELDRYVADQLPVKPADACTWEADGTTIRNLWRLERYSDYFQRLAESVPVVGLARRLLASTPVLMGVETFNKPAKVGSGVPWHQDNAYFCQSPPNVLTLWVALDRVTPENGPVGFIKGSHHGGMLPTRQSGVRGNSIGLAEPPQADAEDIYRALLSPGDATVHHCQTVHSSEGNQTDHRRLALLFVFRGSETQVDPALQTVYTDAATATPPA
ncbi:MAG: phytanoyl-CoA dioxygenase family protein [Pirellulaceae bacterium]